MACARPRSSRPWVLPFAGSLVVIAAWADRPLFHLLTDDDRILEWLQFAGYAAATIFGASIALRLWRARQHALGGLYLAFASGCLFITGEEVSWGPLRSAPRRGRRAGRGRARGTASSVAGARIASRFSSANAPSA